MSDIQERIEGITRLHEWWLAGNLGVPGMVDSTTYKCRCGWNGDEPRQHQAAEIVAALGLTRERRTNVMSSSGMTTDTKTGETTYHSDMRYDQRFVTPWEAQ